MRQICLALFFAGALLAADQVFDLDASKTEISFSVPSTLHTVHGKFKLKNGRIRFDTETGKAAGEIVVDASSGESGSDSRDKRMHKEILETKKYPEAVFIPDQVKGQVEAAAPSAIDVHGILKIHGQDHELTLRFDMLPDGNRYAASTHFTIPYIHWGMKNPSNFLLKVDPNVEVEVKANLIKP
jgi:polyisoprenoid-binding protein YceI